MKRYSIMATQYRDVGEVELCQVDTHPEPIVAAAQEKTLLIKGQVRRPQGPRCEVRACLRRGP
jgi:hypothetical protein